MILSVCAALSLCEPVLSGGVQKEEIEMTRRQKDRAEIQSVSPEVAICRLTALLSSSFQIKCLATLSPVLKLTNVTPNTILRHANDL